jgi:hypothetical protein
MPAQKDLESGFFTFGEEPMEGLPVGHAVSFRQKRGPANEANGVV